MPLLLNSFHRPELSVIHTLTLFFWSSGPKLPWDSIENTLFDNLDLFDTQKCSKRGLCKYRNEVHACFSAEKYSKAPVQVDLRYGIQRGLCIIFKDI
nr:hypothetical transcript [Hymenolepis microstoma]